MLVLVFLVQKDRGDEVEEDTREVAEVATTGEDIEAEIEEEALEVEIEEVGGVEGHREVEEGEFIIP